MDKEKIVRIIEQLKTDILLMGRSRKSYIKIIQKLQEFSI